MTPTELPLFPLSTVLLPGGRLDLRIFERRYLDMRKTTIYAGSNEIQRNIIAKMTLGL